MNLLNSIKGISLFCYICFTSSVATSFDYKDLTHISNLLLPLRNDSSHSKGHRSQNVYLLRNVFSCCHLLLNGFVDDLHIIPTVFIAPIDNARYL